MKLPSHVELLRLLSEAFGPSGHEDDVRDLITSLIGSFVEDIQTDAVGNLIAMRKLNLDGIFGVLYCLFSTQKNTDIMAKLGLIFSETCYSLKMNWHKRLIYNQSANPLKTFKNHYDK